MERPSYDASFFHKLFNLIWSPLLPPTLRMLASKGQVDLALVLPMDHTQRNGDE